MLDVSQGQYSLLEQDPNTHRTPNEIYPDNQVDPQSFDKHDNSSAWINLRINDNDKKQFTPSKKNINVYNTSCYIIERMEYYKDQEIKNNLCTGLECQYNFDLIDYIYEWCNCSNENECKYFKLLMQLNQSLGLSELSMGMSADFKEALKYNTTFVRIGSAIFGKRV